MMTGEQKHTINQAIYTMFMAALDANSDYSHTRTNIIKYMKDKPPYIYNILKTACQQVHDKSEQSWCYYKQLSTLNDIVNAMPYEIVVRNKVVIMPGMLPNCQPTSTDQRTAKSMIMEYINRDKTGRNLLSKLLKED